MAAQLLPIFAKRNGRHNQYRKCVVNTGSIAETSRKSQEWTGQAPVRNNMPGHAPAKAACIENILVAVDFSDSSKAALEYALSIADKFEAAVTLVHAVEPYIYQDDLALGTTLEEIDARWNRKQKEKLEILRQSTVRNGTPSTVIVASGVAWTKIVETAKSRQADLIVIGTRGLTGLKHVLMGSTAERVVRHAHCPVMVVHAPQK
jgi:nucleotide-binding universal stress UspA family protein